MADEYLQRFRQGPFRAVMRWEALDALWDRLREEREGWYIYAIGEAPPARPAEPAALERFISEIDRLLRAEHDEDYCGIVYVDDVEDPAFIKIYDPNNLGVVCGPSEQPPLPGWTLSRLPPVDLPAAMPPPAGRRRWWHRLLAR